MNIVRRISYIFLCALPFLDLVVVGVRGFRIRGGQLAEPLGEMNVAGNHLELWRRLAAVGNDPYRYSALRTPTLVFEGVQIAGT